MRALTLLRARKDVVDLLLRHGRLLDVPMAGFFQEQVEAEVKAAEQAGATETTTTPATTPAITIASPSSNKATSTTASGEAKESDGTAPAAAAAAPTATDTTTAVVSKEEQEKTRQVALRAKQAALQALIDREAKVRQQAVQQGPLGWLGEVYGRDVWSSSYFSSTTTKAAQSGGDGQHVKVSGTATVVGEPGSTPHATRLVVHLREPSEGAGNRVAVVQMPLQQAGVEQNMADGVLRLHLRDAEAAVETGVQAKDVATHQHVLTAAAYGGILGHLETICALHATGTVRYDALLIRNPAVQKRLSQLACFRYGVDALTSYVTGSAELHGDDGSEGFIEGQAVDIPLIESVVLSMFAESALTDGIQAAWEVVRDTPLIEPRPHRSKPEKLIDYPYIQSLLDTSKYTLTAANGTLEAQANEFLSPILRHTGLATEAGSTAASALLQGRAADLLGFTAGRVHLTAPHINLKRLAQGVEKDIAKLLTTIKTTTDRANPSFTIVVGQYTAELLASVAVLYRCSAALEIDEEVRGTKEWLLTQTFCVTSQERRARILSEYEMACAAVKILSKAAALDSYSTHPVELMNAAPRKASAEETKAGSESGSGSGGTATSSKGKSKEAN